MENRIEISAEDYGLFLRLLAEKEEAEAKAKAEAEAKAKAEAEARALAEAKEPRKGRIVTVVRGKKLPRGGRYRVSWIGETRFGSRVGLEPVDETGRPNGPVGPDGRPELVWTAAGNVEALPECSAECDAEVAAEIAARREAEDRLFARLGGEDGILGRRLRVTSGRHAGVTGRVFWCRSTDSGTRIGLRARPGAEPVWEFLGRCEAAE